MKREVAGAQDSINAALKLLEQWNGDGVPDGDSGEALLRRITLLIEDRRRLAERMGRLEKELGIFREANAETSRLLERKIEEISLLRLITDTTSQAILSQDPFKPILEKLMELFGADNGSIILLNPETGTFEVRVTSGEAESEDLLPEMIDKVARCVVSSGTPCLIDDTEAETRFRPEGGGDPRIRSLVAFPLMLEEATVGILVINSAAPKTFTAETERVLHIIAGQIAIAVQNARLYAEIRKTKEYLENLVERAGDAIFTLDRSHLIVSWNHGAEVIFKREKPKAVAASFYDFVPEHLADGLRSQVCDVLTSGSIATIETDALREDGTSTQIALTLSPIRSADGEIVGVSGIAKDMTERKRVEEELRRLNEAKSSFVSTVSHELRTPLTSIKSLTEILLLEKDSLSDTIREKYLNIINDECDRLSGLITSLLDLQKMGAAKMKLRMEQLKLAEIVKQANDLFESVALPNRIDLDTEILVPDDMTTVTGDRKRLMQVLSNLLSNAIKYTNAGGHIRIAVTREGDKVRLTVSDDGIGISAEDKEKVFEKFYRVDNEITRAKGGTGLGLAITKELVSLHGGDIWVESEEGRGSSFHIVLPAAE
ncbi:MAG: ATP-binding protein [Candidatus Abyssubacteria bacterium]